MYLECPQRMFSLDLCEDCHVRVAFVPGEGRVCLCGVYTDLETFRHRVGEIRELLGGALIEIPGTLAYNLKGLIGRMGELPLEEIKRQFLVAVEEGGRGLSDVARERILQEMERIVDKDRLMFFITGLVLRRGYGVER